MIGRLQKHLAWIEIVSVTNEPVYYLEILLKHAWLPMTLRALVEDAVYTTQIS